jgi:hypothetical protein
MMNGAMKKGFKMYKDTYAAISYGNSGYIIIHNGQQLDVINTVSQARAYIKQHKKFSLQSGIVISP